MLVRYQTCRLPASWQLGGSDLPDLELENWVERTRPSNKQEEEADFILENKIFCYAPHSGHLTPGETCTVRPTGLPSSPDNCLLRQPRWRPRCWLVHAVPRCT
jgi:hypothetical protein